MMRTGNGNLDLMSWQQPSGTATISAATTLPYPTYPTCFGAPNLRSALGRRDEQLVGGTRGNGPAGATISTNEAL